MTHTHTAKTNRTICNDTLSTCACGARKYSSGYAIDDGVLDTDGWYVSAETPETKKEATRRHAVEMLETEGYGYGEDKQDYLDSHDPRNQD